MSTAVVDSWIVEVDEVETRLDAKERVTAHLSGLEQQPRGRLSILIDRGPVKGWRRFLGAQRDVSPCFSVEWDAGYASLIFLDDAWSEHRAIDSTHPVEPGEDVRHNIAHGEPRPHPIAECMDKTRAFTAMRDYISNGVRPDWLTYRYVP